MIEKFRHILLNINMSSQKEWLFDIFNYAIALLIFSLILLNASPSIIRMISSKVRIGFTGFLPFFILFLYIAFRLPGALGRFFSVTLSFSLFALALMGLWTTGLSQTTIFNGIVPLYDASGYYTDALRLLNGQDFSSFSGRRPLFPGMLAVLLAITNRNLMISLGILTAITAGACYLAAQEIKRSFGPEAAIFVLMILFFFYRYNSGPVMSESLGVPLGVLGFVLLWRGASNSKPLMAWLGLFISTIALNARAGAFFVLPLMLIWGSWAFRQQGAVFSRRFFLIGLAALGAAFFINWIIFRLLSTPSATLFANFSYSFYGLASGGKNWWYIFTTHPELLKLQEPLLSDTIYKMAFEQILHDPSLLVHGMVTYWQTFFSNSMYGAYSYVSKENANESPIVYWGLYILCALGIFKWFRKPFDPFSSLVILATLGILISVPFLPPSDASRLRPYAASIMIFALLPMMGLLFILEQIDRRIHLISKPNLIPSNHATVIFLSLLITLGMTLGPFIIKKIGKLPILPPTRCDTDTVSVVVSIDPGAYFNVTPDEDTSFQDGLPNFHLSSYKRSSHGLPDLNLINWATRLKPPVTIFDTLDYRSDGSVMVVSSSKLIPAPGTLLEVCGHWETDQNLSSYNIFYAQSTNILQLQP